MLLLTNTDVIIESMEEYLHQLLNIGGQVHSQNTESGVLRNQKIKWRCVQGITTIMELKMESVLKEFDKVCELMHGALMHKDQQVALAASEFWSGINNTKLEENDEIRVKKI